MPRRRLAHNSGPPLLALVLTCVTVGCSSVTDSGTSERTADADPKVLDDVVAAASATKTAPASNPTASEPVADWPNWLGPGHDGISSEKGWSTQWPEGGLAGVWTREIGIGFSSVSIADGRLFTMGHIDGIEHVYALDAHTGKKIWSHSYPCKLVDNLHEGGPGSTPTVDGPHVYTVGREGQLFCFRAESGQIVWQKSLQDDLDVSLPEWGFTSSALIVGNQLVLEGGRVVSYAKLTGEKIWETDKHRAGYGSAALFQHDGKPRLATLDCDGLRVTDADNGAEIAFAAWDSPYGTNSTTPIVHAGKIFVSSGYNVGCGLFTFDGQGLAEVYSNRDMRNHFNNSILVDGYLYGFDGNSNLGRVVRLTCMNYESGEVAWSQRGFGCGSLMVADGKLLILGDDGTLAVAEATQKGYRELSRSTYLDGRCWTIPVLWNKRIYGRNAAGKLVCAQLPK